MILVRKGLIVTQYYIYRCNDQMIAQIRRWAQTWCQQLRYDVFIGGNLSSNNEIRVSMDIGMMLESFFFSVICCDVNCVLWVRSRNTILTPWLLLDGITKEHFCFEYYNSFTDVEGKREVYPIKYVIIVVILEFLVAPSDLFIHFLHCWLTGTEANQIINRVPVKSCRIWAKPSAVNPQQNTNHRNGNFVILMIFWLLAAWKVAKMTTSSVENFIKMTFSCWSLLCCVLTPQQQKLESVM